MQGAPTDACCGGEMFSAGQRECRAHGQGRAGQRNFGVHFMKTDRRGVSPRFKPWLLWIALLLCSTVHAQDTQSPTTPANLTAVATSSSTVVVNWNASADNVGVTGYQLERCQGSGCNSSFTAF